MPAHLPTRLHHSAYVTSDMETTRHFYEDLIGMPLVATWCESDELFGKPLLFRLGRRQRTRVFPVRRCRGSGAIRAAHARIAYSFTSR